MKDIAARLRAFREPKMDGKSTWVPVPICVEAADALDAAHKRIEELEAALKPFAAYMGEQKKDVAKGKPGILYERGANGHYCLPDGHGFQIVWADEDDDDDVVEFTAGQFRRARRTLAGGEHG